MRVAISCQLVGGLYSDLSLQCGAGPGRDVSPIVRQRSMYTIDTSLNHAVMSTTRCLRSMKRLRRSAMPGSRAVRVSLTGRQGDSSVCSGITRKPISNSGSPGVCTYVAKFTVTVVGGAAAAVAVAVKIRQEEDTGGGGVGRKGEGGGIFGLNQTHIGRKEGVSFISARRFEMPQRCASY